MKRRGRKNRELDPENLPNQARALRLHLEMSLNDVAARIPAEVQSLSEFELTGKGLGTLKQYSLAEVLNVGLGELLTPGKKFADNIRLSLDFIR